MSFFTFFFLFISGFLQFPTPATPTTIQSSSSSSLGSSSSIPDPFKDIFYAFNKWDTQLGCPLFKQKLPIQNHSVSSIQTSGTCTTQLKLTHVSVLVKKWTWLPDNLENLYSCPCGLTCLWTKSSVLVDHPDALLFETVTPPLQKWDIGLCLGLPEQQCIKNVLLLGICHKLLGKKFVVHFNLWGALVYYEIIDILVSKVVRSLPPARRSGDPLRVYMDLEAGRKRSGFEDLFIGYHAEDDVQSTYAGALFHNGRNYQVSSRKNNDTLVYWSSSRCLSSRNQLANRLLSLLPHHSFGKCLNNVGGPNKALSFYPECANDASITPKWWDHLHCAMSHYKFVLAIENTMTESYVTEKLFYALDSGSVPIYFGAPNVWDFVPPKSIIDGSKFRSMEELASYVKRVGNDPVAYAEYHAWRRCGVMGNYGKARATSLDTLPCRLCEAISRKGGRNA
ncbi:hypothetical protein ACFE04_007104 [Oxalis oulophora]